jgi:RNA polymerase sigma-70 factor (ECF subfamily)
MAFIPPQFDGMEQYSDEQVVDFVLQGQPELYELLMRRYNQRLFRVAGAIVKDDAEAQDVMQDAYVRAYAGLSGFRGQSSFATWLTRITVNEALARAKRRGFLESIDDFEITGKGEISGSPRILSPEQTTAQQELKAVLETLVDALPVSYRSVFVLRHVEGLSVKETAECLQISEEAVKMRSHRARALLKRHLKERLGIVSSEIFPLRLPVCDGVVAGTFQRLKGAGQTGPLHSRTLPH